MTLEERRIPMYLENNDIRSLRDRAPDGCGCERDERERWEKQGVREARDARAEHTFCPLCRHHSHASGQGTDCSNYFITLGAPLAAVYSPIQVWKDIYSETQALSRGTLFAELDKPLLAKGRKCK